MNALLFSWRVRAVEVAVLLACLPAFGAASDGAPARAIPQMVNVVQTNWAPRAITNVIQVWMPSNVFVTEYRTNLFQKSVTNVTDLCKTNWLSRTLTNLTAVEQVQTNWVTRYRTNFSLLTLTNWETVAAFRTNWTTKTLTNTVVVERTRTNLVSRYRTNSNTLTVTNWETVLVFRTNWVTQPVTNLAVVNIPVAPAELSRTAAPVDPPAPAATAATAPANPVAPLTLDAARTGKPPANNQFEVQLKLKSGRDAAPAMPVQEWRVARLDGSVLMLGQGRELKLELPPGTFSVEVRARLAANAPLVRVRGTLLVARDGVSSRTLQ